MKLYISHSKNYDYRKDLYKVLRSSTINTDHQIILPYETDEFQNTKDIVKSADAVIAEVSFPSIGEGIELGWASDMNVPIICIYREGKRVANSLKVISNIFIQYTDNKDMIEKIITALTAIRNGM